MILYFSGTGNSAYVAKEIAQELQDELLNINDRIKRNDYSSIQSKKSLVFVLPTYAWRIPRVVENWIKATQFPENMPSYFIMTCGGDIGNAEKYLVGLCRKKKFLFRGVKELVMPENYIALYDAPGTEEAKQIIERAQIPIQESIKIIHQEGCFQKTESTVKDKVKSSVVNHMFYPFVVKANKFKADDKCIGCGKCVTDCSLNNIRLVERKPVWGNRCTHCMACICKCPVEAIEYGHNSVGKQRYQFPYFSGKV